MTVSTNSGRFAYLDSIRGVAAFIVVLSHCSWFLPETFRDAHRSLGTSLHSVSDFLSFCAVRFADTGRPAVMIFFALSGFVLAHSLLKKHTPYAGFVIKRLFRLWPALIAAVLGSYLLYRFIGVRQEVDSSWLQHFMRPDLDRMTLLKHLIFWGTRNSIALDNPIWSLVYETRISLIFPVLFWATRHWPIKSLVIAWLASLGCVALRLHMIGMPIAGFDQDNLRESVFSTAYFVVFFVAGICLAVKREKIILALSRLPWGLRAVLLVVALICLFKSSTEIGLMLAVSDYLRAIGAVALLAIVLADKTLQAALTFRIPVWLGRVSYSLYLVHVPIIYAVSQLRGEDWSIAETTLVVIAASLATAEVMARSIEFPFIRIGQKICRKIPHLEPAPAELRGGGAIGATRSSIASGR